jgi:2-polyprenylphenol 6-hydroxylase
MLVKEAGRLRPLRGYNRRMDVDVVIVGGGLAGASFAAALADSGLRLALIERKPPPVPVPRWDSRIYALTPASVAFLEDAGAWRGIDSARITPIHDMRIFGDGPRARLDFSAHDTGVLELAATVESGRLQHALWQVLERQRNLKLLCPAAPARLGLGAERAEIMLEDGAVITAKLAVGADGADSWLRRAAGIETSGAGYGQLGVVANFTSALAHRNRAFQWFRRDGVLAWLPLPDRRISIVWSTPEAHAGELLALSPAAFCRRVADAGGKALGELEPVTPPAAFKLQRMSAQHMVRSRIALVGDAAHVVHPLAGQGINLGFGDAHALAGILCSAGAADPGGYPLLRRYERSRAEDVLALRWITDGLFRLFAAEAPIAGRIRNLGLNLTNSIPVVKNLLASRAVGIGGGRTQRAPR